MAVERENAKLYILRFRDFRDLAISMYSACISNKALMPAVGNRIRVFTVHIDDVYANHFRYWYMR